MFLIGIDPHKGSYTAVVVDGDDRLVDELRVRADRSQRDPLSAWAGAFTPRTWAIEGAAGTGALLAQQLAAAGEFVVSVPPTWRPGWAWLGPARRSCRVPRCVPSGGDDPAYLLEIGDAHNAR
jgi:hypothetical protein